MQDHPERQVQLTSLKNGGKGLAWVSYSHDTGIEKEEFNNPLRLLEGLINVVVRKKIQTNASFKGSINQEISIYYLEPDIPSIIQNLGGLSDDNSVLLLASASDREKT